MAKLRPGHCRPWLHLTRWGRSPLPTCIPISCPEQLTRSAAAVTGADRRACLDGVDEQRRIDVLARHCCTVRSRADHDPPVVAASAQAQRRSEGDNRLTDLQVYLEDASGLITGSLLWSFTLITATSGHGGSSSQ